MKSIDLTDIDDNLVIESQLIVKRIGKIYLSTESINSTYLKRLYDLPIDLIINFNVVSRPAMKGKDQTIRNDIRSLHLPIENFDAINFDFLNGLNEILESAKKGILLCHDSSDLLAGLFGAYFANICGHPIKRSYDIACRLGLENNLEKNKMKKYLNLTGEFYEK